MLSIAVLSYLYNINYNNNSIINRNSSTEMSSIVDTVLGIRGWCPKHSSCISSLDCHCNSLEKGLAAWWRDSSTMRRLSSRKMPWTLGPNIDPYVVSPATGTKWCVAVKLLCLLLLLHCLCNSPCLRGDPVQIGWGKSIGAGGIPHLNLFTFLQQTCSPIWSLTIQSTMSAGLIFAPQWAFWWCHLRTAKWRVCTYDDASQLYKLYV